MSATTTHRVKKPTILIVDDTLENLVVLADFLGSHGVSVMVAQVGEEGVERAQLVEPGLILLNVMMPGLNGFDACRRLKAKIVERTRIQGELHEREMRIRRLIESNIIGIFYGAAGRHISEVNDAFLCTTGYSREDMQVGKLHWTRMTSLQHRSAEELALEQLHETGTCTPYEKEFIGKGGRRLPTLVGGAFVEGSKDTGVGFVLDLSDRKRAEERIHFMAHHDALTELPNRILLQDRMTQTIAWARRSGTQLAVLFIDLDDCKRINDSIGHQVGDRLLQMVAGRAQDSRVAEGTVHDRRT